MTTTLALTFLATLTIVLAFNHTTFQKALINISFNALMLSLLGAGLWQSHQHGDIFWVVGAFWLVSSAANFIGATILHYTYYRPYNDSIQPQYDHIKGRILKLDK